MINSQTETCLLGKEMWYPVACLFSFPDLAIRHPTMVKSQEFRTVYDKIIFYFCGCIQCYSIMPCIYPSPISKYYIRKTIIFSDEYGGRGQSDTDFFNDEKSKQKQPVLSLYFYSARFFQSMVIVIIIGAVFSFNVTCIEFSVLFTFFFL